MVYRGMNPDHSIPAVLADVAAVLGPEAPTPTDSAWCQARSRLPEAVLRQLIARRARECQRRFPVARVTFIELAGLNVIWNYRMDEYRCSEECQLYDMWHTLPTGCICLLDRKFCSFYNLAKLQQRRIGVVTPLHQGRDPQRLIHRGRALGENQWLVPFHLQSYLRKRYNDPSLPKVLFVRLIRVRFRHGRKCKTLWLVTTLMDPVKYPAREVSQLYRTRWKIEPRIGSLKTTLKMNVLRSKNPPAARREVAAIILGHNLTWMRIHESARVTNTPVETISFAGAVKVILAFSPALLDAPPCLRRVVYQKMLRQIARQTNHHPPGRVEPRRIRRNTIHYPFLREPRWKARLKCLS